LFSIASAHLFVLGLEHALSQFDTSEGRDRQKQMDGIHSTGRIANFLKQVQLVIIVSIFSYPTLDVSRTFTIVILLDQQDMFSLLQLNTVLYRNMFINRYLVVQ